MRNHFVSICLAPRSTQVFALIDMRLYTTKFLAWQNQLSILFAQDILTQAANCMRSKPIAETPLRNWYSYHTSGPGSCMCKSVLSLPGSGATQRGNCFSSQGLCPMALLRTNFIFKQCGILLANTLNMAFIFWSVGWCTSTAPSLWYLEVQRMLCIHCQHFQARRSHASLIWIAS